MYIAEGEGQWLLKGACRRSRIGTYIYRVILLYPDRYRCTVASSRFRLCQPARLRYCASRPLKTATRRLRSFTKSLQYQPPATTHIHLQKWQSPGGRCYLCPHATGGEKRGWVFVVAGDDRPCSFKIVELTAYRQRPVTSFRNWSGDAGQTKLVYSTSSGFNLGF